MSLSSYAHAPMPEPQSNITRTVWKSPIGSLGLVQRGAGLAQIAIDPNPASFPFEVERTFGGPGKDAAETFSAVLSQLQEYFAGRRLIFRIPLDLNQGTPFQRRVWKTLKDIPYGETVSYKEIAETIGHPSAIRAVGSAVGKNPLPIILPCHRVVASDGSIGGFSAGVPTKKKLLALEQKTRAQVAQYGMLTESRTNLRRPW